MSNATLTLTKFLLARIAEDEAAASVGGPSNRQWDHETDEGEYVATIGATVARVNLSGWGAHIARHDPARVLVECEAKRRIVAAFEDERQRRDIYNRSYDAGLLTTNDDIRNRLASNAHCRGLEIAMLAHAATHADHPDFCEEWAP